MRVLQVNKFFREKGGTERYFFSLSRALERRGHSVLHLSMHHPENLDSPFAPYFVERRDYSPQAARLDDFSRGLAFIRSREAARKTEALVRDLRPEMAHLHNIYHQITPSIIPVLREAGIPIVMTLHDHKLICPNYSMFDGRAFCYRCRGRRFHQAAIARCNEGSFPRSLLLTVEAYWQKWSRVYDGIRYFITPSRYLRDTFLAEGFAPDRVVYVAPFVARDSWGARAAPGGATAASAPVRSLPERYVLYFGRIGPEKGLLTLLEAVCQLRGVSLVVCGEGPLRERLEARAARGGGAEIVFTGFLGRAALDGVIRRSSVVVLPSISPENAPYTVLEAMALGRPVIVSNLGGLPELAGSGGGLIFEAGSANSLASRIREVWEDEELASSLGRKGAQFVEDRLTEDRHLDEIESLYRMAVA